MVTCNIFSRYIIVELVRKRTFILECDVLLFPYGKKKRCKCFVFGYFSTPVKH